MTNTAYIREDADFSMTGRIEFKAKYLASVAQAQSREESRYYLCGVFFDGEFAVASNGHVLTVARDKKRSANYRGIFPISSKAITAMKKPRSATVVIEDGILNVMDRYNNVFYQEDVSEIDGTFPEWRKILPTGDFRPTVLGFNAEVMAIVSSVSRILNNVGFTIKEKDDGVRFPRCLVTYDRNQDIKSVIQPCELRGSQDVPEWYTDCVQEAL